MMIESNFFSPAKPFFWVISVIQKDEIFYKKNFNRGDNDEIHWD